MGIISAPFAEAPQEALQSYKIKVQICKLNRLQAYPDGLKPIPIAPLLALQQC